MSSLTTEDARDEWSPPGVPLSRDRVLRAAVAFADESGIASLTMRKLGEALGVEAMSLYNHVANKDELLGAMVDFVFSEIELPPDGADWRTAMRDRAVSARQVAGAPPVGDRPDGHRGPHPAPRRCAITTR